MQSREVTIAEIKDDTWTMNIENLKAILMAEKCRHKRVVVISMCGPCRIGKSFMLNYMLRFLQAGGKRDWLGGKHTPLTGFGWSHSDDPKTEGIMMWSQPYSLTLPNGDDVVVLLLDTEDLIILVRDWKHENVGFAAGREHWEKTKKENENTHGDQRTIGAIEDNFSSLRCFLLPHPGPRVSKPGCNGSLAFLEDDFILQMQTLIESLLQTQNLKTKHIHGCEITCEDLFIQCKKYNALLKSSGLLELENISEANAQMHLSVLSKKAESSYEAEMRLGTSEQITICIEELDKLHRECLNRVLEEMRTATTIAYTEEMDECLRMLESRIMDHYGVRRDNFLEAIESRAKQHDHELTNILCNYYETMLRETLKSRDAFDDARECDNAHLKASKECLEILTAERKSTDSKFRDDQESMLETFNSKKYEAFKWAAVMKSCLNMYEKHMHDGKSGSKAYKNHEVLKRADLEARKISMNPLFQAYPDKQGMETKRGLLKSEIDQLFEKHGTMTDLSLTGLYEIDNYSLTLTAQEKYIEEMKSYFERELKYRFDDADSGATREAMYKWNHGKQGHHSDWTEYEDILLRALRSHRKYFTGIWNDRSERVQQIEENYGDMSTIAHWSSGSTLGLSYLCRYLFFKDRYMIEDINYTITKDKKCSLLVPPKVIKQRKVR